MCLYCNINQFISVLESFHDNWHDTLAYTVSMSWEAWKWKLGWVEELYWRRSDESVNVNEGTRRPHCAEGKWWVQMRRVRCHDGSGPWGQLVLAWERETRIHCHYCESGVCDTTARTSNVSRSSMRFLQGLRHRSIVSPAEDLCMNLNCYQLPDTLSVWAILCGEKVFFPLFQTAGEYSQIFKLSLSSAWGRLMNIFL